MNNHLLIQCPKCEQEIILGVTKDEKVYRGKCQTCDLVFRIEISSIYVKGFEACPYAVKY